MAAISRQQLTNPLVNQMRSQAAPAQGEPFDLADALFGEESLWGGATRALGFGAFETPVISGEEWEAIWNVANGIGMETPGRRISPEDMVVLQGMYDTGETDAASLWTFLSQKMFDYGANQDEIAETAQIAEDAAAVRLAQTGRLDTFATDAREQMGGMIGRNQEEIERFQRLRDVPGAIRSDAEYGNMLAASEQIAKRQAENTRRQAAHATAQSGLRSSGRAADTSLRAQEVASGQIAEGFNRAQTNVLGRLDASNLYADYLGGQKISLEDSIRQGYTDIEAGIVPTAFNLAGMRLQPHFTPFDVYEETYGKRFAEEAAQLGGTQQGIGTVLNFASLGTDAIRGGVDDLGRYLRPNSN